jgi:hypothetical protein
MCWSSVVVVSDLILFWIWYKFLDVLFAWYNDMPDGLSCFQVPVNLVGAEGF